MGEVGKTQTGGASLINPCGRAPSRDAGPLNEKPSSTFRAIYVGMDVLQNYIDGKMQSLWF